MIRKFFQIDVLLLIAVSALTYLPYATRLTYYLDDWYYIYDGYIGGANIFHSMFSIDRPARGYVFDAYYSLFGPAPIFYHVGSLAWRLVAGTCALWVFKILWPSNEKFNFFVALMFVLYPGYAWWISTIEYQPMMVSLGLQVLSVLLTLKVLQEGKFPAKLLYSLGAILTGWGYLALVEYAIGMEVFRFLCVYLYISKGMGHTSAFGKILNAVKAWSWNVIIPLGFVYWRLNLFESQRKATDIGVQLSRFKESPLESLESMIINFSLSVGNASFHAWFRQLYLRFLDAGDSRSAYGLVIAFCVALILVVARRQFSNPSLPEIHEKPSATAWQAAMLGFVSLLFGVFPVVLAGRYINLTIYSHYGLPVSLVAALFLVGIIHLLLKSSWVSDAVTIAFVAMAVLTNSLIGEKTLLLQKSVETYWWQVSWRIPALRPDSTLVTLYPYQGVADTDYGLVEPANLIYFREPQDAIPVRYPVSTLLPAKENRERIIANRPKEGTQYRTHRSLINYRNILVLTQPTPDACVRVIDGANYVLSESEFESIKDIAPYSKVENVRSHLDFVTPQKFAFGLEPDHGWCYYFEKADFAVQVFDWETAANLGDMAISQSLVPSNQVEWYPFIQGYSMIGDKEKLEMIAVQIDSNRNLKRQICNNALRLNDHWPIDLSNRRILEELFCN